MTQEPGPWELQRRLDQIATDQAAGFDRLDKRLDRLVTTEAFAAEQRRVDDKLKDLADDIATEQQERKAGDESQRSDLNRFSANQKWLVVSVLIPIGLFITNLLMSRGGS